MLTSRLGPVERGASMVRRVTKPLRHAVVVFASFFLITVG
jgi:hypothetical protein